MKYKYLCLFFLQLVAYPAWAQGKNLVCDPFTNVCTVAIAENYCGADGIAASKWDMRSDSFVLSCACDCTDQDNTFWIIRPDRTVSTLAASKVVSSIDIARNGSVVPDIFGVVPYCTAVKTDKPGLVYLQKQPANTPASYCYAVIPPNAARACSSTQCLHMQTLVSQVESSAQDQVLVEFKNATARLYQDKQRFDDFPKKDFIEPYLKRHSGSPANQQLLNDIAYFWQQAGFNADAIWLLTNVIENDPKRVVAYLNIADAYWSDGNKISAVKNYRLYIEMMNASGKQAKIPLVVMERAK